MAHSGGSSSLHELSRSTAIILGAFLLAYIATYMMVANEVMHSLHSQWLLKGSLDVGYAFLAISCFFLFRQNQSQYVPSPDYRYLVAVAGSNFLIALMLQLDIESAAQLLIIVGFFFTSGAIFGTAVALKTITPTLIVVMALPIWYLFSPILQQLTVKSMSVALSASNTPAFIEGEFITIISGTVQVAEGCSGLKYFICATALTFIMYNIVKLNWRKRILITIFLMGLAILSNWIRVFILILVGHHYGIDNPLMSDHDSLGWILFFVFVAIPLYFINVRLQSHQVSNIHTKPVRLPRKRRSIMIGLLLTCLAIALPYLIIQQLVVSDHNANNTAISLPNNIAKQMKMAPTIDQWRPHFIGYTAQLNARYSDGLHPFDISVLRYNRTHTDGELISYDNQIFDPTHWRKISNAAISSTSESDYLVAIAAHRASNTKRIVVYWYEIGDYMTTSGFKLKVLTLLKPRLQPKLVALSQICVHSCDSAYQHLITIKNEWHD